MNSLKGRPSHSSGSNPVNFLNAGLRKMNLPSGSREKMASPDLSTRLRYLSSLSRRAVLGAFLLRDVGADLEDNFLAAVGDEPGGRDDFQQRPLPGDHCVPVGRNFLFLLQTVSDLPQSLLVI